MIDAAYVQAMELHSELPYTEQAFGSLLNAGKGNVITIANDIEAVLLNSLKVLGDVRQKLAAMDVHKWQDTRADIEEQLSHLLAASFLRDTPADALTQYPRYMKALRTRLERLSGQYPKDQKYTELLQSLSQPVFQAVGECAGLLTRCDEAREYRWMLEEFRVSLFAQNLGTRQAVSEKRLAEKWRAVRLWLDKNPF